MKFLRSLPLILGISFYSIAQNINQFDADGERHGKWQKNYEGTKVLRYEGEFDHGKEVGAFKFYKNHNGNGILAVTKSFQPDSNQALVTFFNDSGKRISEGFMIGKTYVGEWKYYMQGTNTILTIEHYNDNGLLEGKQLVYYMNGQIAEEKYYANGKLEGESKWFAEDGTVLKAFNYSNGELHGLSKYYDAKGDLIIEGNYKNGKKDGIWKYYKDAKIVKEEDFSYKPKYIKVNGKYKKAP